MGGWIVHDLMVKFPASWPEPVVVIVCMVVLAGLDLAGALAAAEGLARRSNVLLALGAVSFLFLFWFYASSLQYAELAVVTFGWIVLLQISLVLLDRLHYGVSLAPGKWVAILVILAAQGYLVLGQDRSAATEQPAATTAAPPSMESTAGHSRGSILSRQGGSSPVKG
jgi:hypothetical protein